MTRIGSAVALFAAGLLVIPAAAQESKTLVREFVTLAGTVERIDRTSRAMTLRIAPDLTQDVYVPAEFALFDELKTGDKVSARIRESVIVAARPGLKPQIVTDTTADAANKRGTTGGPDLIQQLKIAVTIESIDRKAQVVTYKTADNRHVVRAVADPQLLEGLKPGDVVEVTMTRERVVELQRR
jgi:Cu/Ag efflux protein CusF